MTTHIFATSTRGEVLEFPTFTSAVRSLRMDHTDEEIVRDWIIEEFGSPVPGSGPRTHLTWTPTIETTRLGDHLVWPASLKETA